MIIYTQFCLQFTFFLNFATKKNAKILRLGKKKNNFFCFALDFSYLCIRNRKVWILQALHMSNKTHTQMDDYHAENFENC